ncbi:MAG: PilZ domain-containing protein [Firmicutes bacterium]|nr:PilZ domain-containing protein [Bacillota bacterium]
MRMGSATEAAPRVGAAAAFSVAGAQGFGVVARRWEPRPGAVEIALRSPSAALERIRPGAVGWLVWSDGDDAWRRTWSVTAVSPADGWIAGGLVGDPRPAVRRAQRASVWAPCRVLWPGGAVEGVTRDLSRTGASALCEAPVPVGAEVRWAIHWPDGPWEAAGRVARCEPEGPGRWLVACAWTAMAPAAAERLALVIAAG